jgi:hypothetical protein
MDLLMSVPPLFTFPLFLFVVFIEDGSWMCSPRLGFLRLKGDEQDLDLPLEREEDIDFY